MVSKTDLNCNLAGALMPPQSTVSLRGPPGKFRQRPEFRQREGLQGLCSPRQRWLDQSQERDTVGEVRER